MTAYTTCPGSAYHRPRADRLTASVRLLVQTAGAAAIAKACDVSTRTVYRWAAGATPMTLGDLERLLAAADPSGLEDVAGVIEYAAGDPHAGSRERVRQIAERRVAREGWSPTRRQVYRVLAREGGPLRPADVARLLGCSRGLAWDAMDWMYRKGYATRDQGAYTLGDREAPEIVRRAAA